ncbi:MAG: 16S rRNA (cytidine(1402)-2'-O)-methyltransferase [Anaerolineae bacterium]|nr:16S rRNA (cytidine(1402)-2'-O)-methyltransferase [Anaerolineae bacterium]
MHTLYIVATPIGNLEDITLRALRVLREVRLIAAEDTRTTRKLLDRYQIAAPLTSYHEHNKLSKLDVIFEALAEGDVALVSDAGTPGISDPGYELIGEAIARGVTVVPIPGPNALVAALVGSGLPTDGFVYLGFLPRKAAALRSALHAVSAERRTLIAYESPNRLVETLDAVIATLGDRPVVVARELTKLHEQFIRGNASAVRDHFRENEPRGEITLLIGGAPDQPAETWDDERVRDALRALLADGLSRRDAARLVAEQSGRERRAVYDLSLDV